MNLLVDDMTIFIIHKVATSISQPATLDLNTVATAHGVNKWPEPLSQILQHRFF